MSKANTTEMDAFVRDAILRKEKGRNKRLNRTKTKKEGKRGK
jgi:hypothetical protein